ASGGLVRTGHQGVPFGDAARASRRFCSAKPNGCGDPLVTTLHAVDMQTALRLHLFEHPPQNGVKYQSGFIALLKDARGSTGRDENGVVVRDEHTQSWIGAAAYMILLDQVGTCFAVPGQTPVDREDMIHALRAFSGLTDNREIQALYALRCAYAHDYS